MEVHLVEDSLQEQKSNERMIEEEEPSPTREWNP